MKYSDLVQFETLERVIKLTQDLDKQKAKNLVSSYVISDTMADRLSNIVFRHLQFEEWADNMGLLIVGNYGTGKSHLMSVISAIAEDAEMVQYICNKTVAESAKSIAGKFKVIRAEIGSRDVDKKMIADHVTSYGNLLWYLFTWGKVPCFKGDEARDAFDALDYSEAIRFYDGYANHIEGVSIIDKISAKKVDKDRKSDVYIVAKDFSWTYVRTHEVDFGPYLCVKKYTNYNLSD